MSVGDQLSSRRPWASNLEGVPDAEPMTDTAVERARRQAENEQLLSKVNDSLGGDGLGILCECGRAACVDRISVNLTDYMVCTGSKGNAVASYDFYLPDNLYGTPAMYVYGEKLCCATSSIGRKLVKVSKLHYRIRVAVSKRTRFDLQSVSLSYYVKT